MIESTESHIWAPMYGSCKACGGGPLIHAEGAALCWSCGWSSVPDATGCNEMTHTENLCRVDTAHETTTESTSQGPLDVVLASDKHGTACTIKKGRVRRTLTDYYAPRQ